MSTLQLLASPTTIVQHSRHKFDHFNLFEAHPFTCPSPAMATTFPRYNYIISRTLDPLFALFIGFSAAGMRIRREENEKRLGMATTSIAGSTIQMPNQKPETGSQNGPEGEVGYAEIASTGWGRIKRSILEAVQW